MSDRITEPGPVAAPTSPARPRWVAPALQSAVILALFAGAGWLGGKLWWELWSPAPKGIVFQQQWIPQPYAAGQGADFAGTGWYVVVALVGGLVLGLVAGLLLDRNEIVTLVAVAVGSLLAAWLMLRVGVSFSAPDPEVLAKTAKEGSELPGRLDLAGKLTLLDYDFHDQVRSPMLAFPIGAMAGLAIALFGISKHRG
jgi:hypothetical protein